MVGLHGGCAPMFSAAFGAALVLSRTSPEPGEILRDDTSGSSALGGREACGGVSLSIFSGENPPTTMILEECREPDWNMKLYIVLIIYKKD